MPRRPLRHAVRLAIALLPLAACAGSEETSWFSSRYNFSGPRTMLDPALEAFSDERLGCLIERQTPGRSTAASPTGSTRPAGGTVAYPGREDAAPSGSSPCPDTWSKSASAAASSSTASSPTAKDDTYRVDDAIAHFYNSYYNAYPKQFGNGVETAPTKPTEEPGAKSPDPDTKFYIARNQIQDQLLLASVQRCNAYEKYLRHLDASEGFLFGALSTILGGAGAIVTGAGGARALAGTAGISSGVGAEARQNIFSNLASAVIVPGIEKRRTELLQEIADKRCHSVQTYTIGFALADAGRFHAACTMDQGISEAAQTVTTAQDPGLQSALGVFQKFAKAQQLVQIVNAQAANKEPPTAPDIGAAATTPTALTVGKATVTLPVDCSSASLVGYRGATTPKAAAPPALPSIPFATNSSTVGTDAATKDAIDKLVTAINKATASDPKTTVTVEGHTTSPDVPQNKDLSTKRAQAAIDALKKAGADKAQYAPVTDTSTKAPRQAAAFVTIGSASKQ